MTRDQKEKHTQYWIKYILKSRTPRTATGYRLTDYYSCLAGDLKAGSWQGPILQLYDLSMYLD